MNTRCIYVHFHRKNKSELYRLKFTVNMQHEFPLKISGGTSGRTTSILMTAIAKPPSCLHHEKLMLKAENHSSAKLKIVFFSQLHSTAVVGK